MTFYLFHSIEKDRNEMFTGIIIQNKWDSGKTHDDDIYQVFTN